MTWQPARIADLTPGRWVRGRVDKHPIEGRVVRLARYGQLGFGAYVAVEPDQSEVPIPLSKLRVNR